jgi:hypothetical protein
MALLVANCPRCKATRMTFDVVATWPTTIQHGWLRRYEAFCICRECDRSTVFSIAMLEYEDRTLFEKTSPAKLDSSLNAHFKIEGFISLKDFGATKPPDHVPELVGTAFREGATSVVTGCWNAAGAMFRLAIDLATKPLLPSEEVPGLNGKTRRDLGLRLPWLFDNGRLPEDLRQLSSCVRDDGNEAAHAGTLTAVEAQDLLNFTIALLERIFTEPERLRLAKERREQRRADEPGSKSG